MISTPTASTVPATRETDLHSHVSTWREDGVVTERVPEAEGYIAFRLSELSSRNEHHRFEEIATRIARRRISANILVATGPVSSGGDQGRDAESYTTRIPNELPNAAGFAASASTDPVVVACTVQKDGLKSKVLADVDSICAEDADPVSHVAYFSVHPISEGVTHKLKKAVRKKYGVTLDVFCGADIATFLAEPDLVWVARHYLELPSSMVPPPEDGPAPQWYTELIEKLRQNGGPAMLTPATQGEVTQGLRHATWDADTNADLPEWFDFMSAFLDDSDDGDDTELIFRACYEIAVARYRGTGSADGVEDLTRRAIKFACTSEQPNIVDDAVTLASYWGVMWSTGVGRAETEEISNALESLREHAVSLLEATDAGTYPVRAASLTGTLAYLHLLPDWRKAEQTRGRPPQVEVAANAGVRLDEVDMDVSAVSEGDLVDASTAMRYLESLVDLLPRARVYSVRELARLFTFIAPVVSGHPSYRKVRDGLDAATAAVEGTAAVAARCRDRGTAFATAGRPLLALSELHDAKLNWFNGDNLYGSVLVMRFLAKLYDELGLSYAAKMYACTAAAVASMQGDDDLNQQIPKALLEAARYAQRSGCWADSARITDIALLARAQHLPDPFDDEKHPDLREHHLSSALGLSLVRKFWPELEPVIAEAHSTVTWWFAQMSEMVDENGENPMSEEEVKRAASEQLTGPVFGDLGPERIVDFEALGVRWTFRFANDRDAVLSSESMIAAFQILLADVAIFEPVILRGTVQIAVDVLPADASAATDVLIDDSMPELKARVRLRAEEASREDRQRDLVAACFQLLEAVVAHSSAASQAFMGPLFERGIIHKLFIGRPYGEVAGLMDHLHYERCAAADRTISDEFRPTASPALTASTTTGAGYDQDVSLQRIRERYEIAGGALRYTLPRLLADSSTREAIVEMREEGWLDWQILVSLANAAWNWRMHQADVDPSDRAAVMRICNDPETAESPEIPLDVFSTAQLAVHIHGQAHAVGARWGLRGRQERDGECAMRDLLTRRYHYAEDDVPHLDLFDEAVAGGVLRPLLVTSGN